MKKIIILACCIVSTSAFAHGVSLTCDYTYLSQHAVLSIDQGASDSQTFVILKDAQCGDTSRTISIDAQVNSFLLTICDRGGVGSMDCENVNRDVAKLKIGENSPNVDFEGDDLGQLHCVQSWH